ncbi:uncharacterized protein TNIN_477441 [Trichonephila inaurata madagascariensis]|uniref:Uncharacterized protein n=1 Tax=Trichonephila inaurata madagascariensis TaxID=2747483 RepID=A0A8X6XX50_9ARAC|nr:uncharacterized protein TNIN_477441 [Trichonephila inaurata madagascariensis]
MNIIYRPPLKHIALVRIALGILRTFDQQAIDTNFLTSNGDVSGKYYSEVIYKIETFLHGRGIPSCIKKEIFGIIRSLALEVERWVYSHNEILHDSDIKFSDICWYSYGVVDRFETAQTLVRKESIEIEPRFALSCKYYFKDHARTLWNSSSIFDKMILADNYGSVRSMWFWIDGSQTDYVTDAILLHHNYVTEIVDFNENYLGLRCYFTRLGPEARYRCLSYGVTEAKIHHFDLYLCFAELTIDEVKDLFRHLSASNRFRKTFELKRRQGSRKNSRNIPSLAQHFALSSQPSAVRILTKLNKLCPIRSQESARYQRKLLHKSSSSTKRPKIVV